jgi:hypothetical protein
MNHRQETNDVHGRWSKFGLPVLSQTEAFQIAFMKLKCISIKNMIRTLIMSIRSYSLSLPISSKSFVKGLSPFIT